MSAGRWDTSANQETKFPRRVPRTIFRRTSNASFDFEPAFQRSIDLDVHANVPDSGV
jgi:hypothetical protein